MGFMEILQQSREEAKSAKQNFDETIQEVLETPKEVVEETPETHVFLGDAIINCSKKALTAKKLKGTNSARRVAKAISTGHITVSQLKKAFELQDRYNKEGHPNFKLVGGKPLRALQYLLKSGLSLNDALNTEYKDY